MVINSISAGQIASSVWAQVTRTLSADPATDAGAATLVWTHATRSLTTGANNFTAIGNINQSVSAGAVLDLRPAAGKFREVTHVQISGTGNNSGLYDGTTFQPGTTAVAVSTMVGGSSIGPAAKNTTGGALASAYSGWDVG